MRKFSLLFGAMGGALAGYILSNDKLRHELTKAKDAEAAAKALGKHLSKDGKKLAGDVKTFVESDDVQKNLKKAKSYAQQKFNEAQKSVREMVAGAAKDAAKTAGKAKKSAMKMKRRAV